MLWISFRCLLVTFPGHWIPWALLCSQLQVTQHGRKPIPAGRNPSGCMHKNWKLLRQTRTRFQTVVLEKTLEIPLESKEIKSVNPKGNQPWIFSLGWLMLKLKLQYFSHPLGIATHSKRPWCWERLRARREGDDRGWDDWRVSLTQWTWVWASSGT